MADDLFWLKKSHPFYPFDGSDLISKYDYVGGTNIIYIGVSMPGTATSKGEWQIFKVTYDGNENITDILAAGGNNVYDGIWDNRAALSYS